MTVEEIKSQYSMRDILSIYGLHENRAGFISCPFHGKDSHPSMKIYKKDYHCFTCGRNGDIFTFIQEMENCSFKDAFQKLGGTYEQKSDWQRRKFQYELEQKKIKAEKELRDKKRTKREILKDISLQKLFIECFPVFSDDWCDSINRLEYDFYLLEELTKEGVRLSD